MAATPDMTYSGTQLTWPGIGNWKATSGLTGHQTPAEQCLKDEGPVPPGLYKVYANNLGAAKDDGTGTCNLSAGWGLQTIPRGADAGDCESYWANWGLNRARLEAADDKTKQACGGTRGGFYLHDSTKGFSHGCIEVQTAFFAQLRAQAKLKKKDRFLLKIDYTGATSTNGRTKV